MAKTLQISLSWSRNSSIVLWCGLALTAVHDKIIYSCGEIDPIKENLGEEKQLGGYY